VPPLSWFFVKLLIAAFFIASLHRLTVKCKLLASQQIAAQQAARAQAELPLKPGLCNPHGK
jgi:hypothetical protein